jgi:hypothetical protein
MSHKGWPSQERFKREKAYAKGTSIGLARSQVPGTNRVKVPPGLIGKPTETEIYIDGSLTSALLDTGSTVSTVSENYYREHISSPLHTLDTLLDIECADGLQLPSIGYTEIQFQLPGHTHLYYCLLLVTQNSRYNSEVPLLLGTNTLSSIIETLKNEHGERFLQISNLTTPWYLSFR